MSKYQKIMRKLISHPGSGILILRKMIGRYRKCCVHCGVIAQLHVHHTDQRGIRTYQCQMCNKTFTETYGTIFYKSKIPISSWLLAIIFWTTATGSISAADLSRKLGVSHPTAWKMLMKMRKKLKNGLGQDMLEGLVEADEAWFGKKANQDIIMGMVERGKRKIRLMVIPNVKEESLYPHIRMHVKTGSRFFTDTRNTYHHGISRKYRKLYLAQYAFSYQFRHSTDLFFKTLCQFFSPTYCLI